MTKQKNGFDALKQFKPSQFIRKALCINILWRYLCNSPYTKITKTFRVFLYVFSGTDIIFFWAASCEIEMVSYMYILVEFRFNKGCEINDARDFVNFTRVRARAEAILTWGWGWATPISLFRASANDFCTCHNLAYRNIYPQLYWKDLETWHCGNHILRKCLVI